MAESLKVCVVGAGPAGFYTADGLVRGLDGPVEVNLVERLPTPFGLVRAGVAPDHQRIKSVTRAFDKIAGGQGIRFHGGIEVGVDVAHEELMERHHAVVYATGAPLASTLDVPGEDLDGVHPAADLVPWYNAHPDKVELDLDLSGTRAVIIGNGNVAIDVARVLLSDCDALAQTDISDRALGRLRTSTLREVAIWGRRGPRHASFTRTELTELVSMDDVDVLLEGGTDWLEQHLAQPGPALDAELESLWRDVAGRVSSGTSRTLVFRFQAVPTGFVGADRVGEIDWRRTEIGGPVDRQSATPVGDVQREAVDLVVTATGYRTRPVDGVALVGASGRCEHTEGRLAPGVYVAGWAKRGPSGVIGTNRSDGTETARSILADHAAGKLSCPSDESLDELLDRRGVSRVGYEGWQRINAAELSRGTADGRPRVKSDSWKLLLAEANSGS
ncbi:FAD-dependent oxidoreductase [Rhodococcus rhodochrous]|uniref:FAD-dependent oxidoreductase n=1 Tax=Rhodococcus rhodochrous TaxID=1829 RepID=UPI001E5EC233|nr:FAD-dependent oxidoreductase [Rhodococcus rhodochrous]MCB8913435.1 FAD-dependent oxidoreductase [Rhodococcus rhodochrous]